jgi:hypothetical protein
LRAGIYVRVSTLDQHAANQLPELHKYVADRGWEAQEYVDRGVSGAKDSRPALNRLLADARRRRFDVIVVWSLDRLGRSLKHLVGLLDDLHAMGVGIISLREGLDWTTPSGRLQAQLLAIIAEFERTRLREGSGETARPIHVRPLPPTCHMAVCAQGRAPLWCFKSPPPGTGVAQLPSSLGTRNACTSQAYTPHRFITARLGRRPRHREIAECLCGLRS